MPAPRLECLSSYGDQTLSGVKYVLHGSSNATESVSIMDEGLRFVEGRPTLSTNLVHSYDWTVNAQKQAQSRGLGTALGEPGSVVVLAVPPNYHLGYGMFTTAYVDRALKRVSGNPLKYAAGRKQLALYLQPDTEAARVHIEADVANGYTLNQRPQLMVEPKYLVGSFHSGPVLENLLTQIGVAARSMQALEFGRFEQSLRELLRPSQIADSATLPEVLHAMVVGTVESIVISRMRMMRWQGLELTGFSFYEGKQQVQITPVKDMSRYRQSMEELGRVLAGTGLFTGEMEWLKSYVSHELELMRMELEAAELESLPD